MKLQAYETEIKTAEMMHPVNRRSIMIDGYMESGSESYQRIIEQAMEQETGWPFAPLLVIAMSYGGHRIINGNRRYQAAMDAGWDQYIPALAVDELEFAAALDDHGIDLVDALNGRMSDLWDFIDGYNGESRP